MSSEIQNFPTQGGSAPLQPPQGALPPGPPLGGQPPGTPVIGQQFGPPPFPAAGSAPESDNDVDVMVSELCIVIWDDKPGQRNWYVGMCRSKDEETYEIEHMERVNMRNNKQSPHERWRWPQDSADIQIALPTQVLPCNVIGSWDTSSSRNITFVLDNWHIIDGLFQSFYN